MPPTRRTLLQASALGLAGSIAGCAGASENRQETETTIEMTTTVQEADETIVLGGETGHWFGLSPSQIHEAENPTLALEPETVYEIVWINIDGAPHELRVFDADDNEVAATESASEVGVTESVTFEATDALAWYDCEYHPENMRGDVVQGELTTTPGEPTTTTENGDGGDGGDGDGPGY